MHSTTVKTKLDSKIIDTIIGYNENKKNECKQKQSQRVLEARRAIEKHHEKKLLCESTEDYWLLE